MLYSFKVWALIPGFSPEIQSSVVGGCENKPHPLKCIINLLYSRNNTMNKYAKTMIHKVTMQDLNNSPIF